MIILGGTIGAGKTSLTKILAKSLGTEAFLEPVKNNPILPLFYKGNELVAKGKMKTNPYTFLLQIYFLNLRFGMIKQAQKTNNNVMDRSIYEDKLFMKLNYDMAHTTKTEWTVYKRLLANMLEELPYAAHKKRPDLLVYLEISLPNQLKHIKKRGRAYEQPTPDNHMVTYYRDLQRYYAQWFKDYAYSPKLKINVDDLDFVNNPNDRKQVLSKIKSKLTDLGKLAQS